MLVAMETKSHDSSDTGVYKQAMNVRGEHKGGRKESTKGGKEGEGEQSCKREGRLYK